MRYPRLFLATLGLAMSVSAADGAVFATPSSQNADDLARENERLKMEVQDLRSRLDAAMKRIAVLEDAAANRSPASSPEGAPPAAIVVEKSPSGMLRKMRADYAATEEAGTIPPRATPGMRARPFVFGGPSRSGSSIGTGVSEPGSRGRSTSRRFDASIGRPAWRSFGPSRPRRGSPPAIRSKSGSRRR